MLGMLLNIVPIQTSEFILAGFEAVYSIRMYNLFMIHRSESAWYLLGN